MEIDLAQAAAPLSKYVANLSESGEIVILDSGKPVAKLVALSTESEKRVPGLDEGLVQISEDFDAPLPPEIANGFGV